MFPTKPVFIWPSGFRGEDFIQKLTNQKQELLVAATFVNGSETNQHLDRGYSMDVSYQVSFHLAKRFQRKRFVKIGQSETKIAFSGNVC